MKIIVRRPNESQLFDEDKMDLKTIHNYLFLEVLPILGTFIKEEKEPANIYIQSPSGIIKSSHYYEIEVHLDFPPETVDKMRNPAYWLINTAGGIQQDVALAISTLMGVRKLINPKWKINFYSFFSAMG